MKYLQLFEQFITEKKPTGAPKWHDSDAPDAEGRFKELSPEKLAAWLIKTRKKDLKAITGSLNQQIVFNRNEDPEYADKMERTRKEVYKQLGRKDLLDKMDEAIDLDYAVNEIGDASAKPMKTVEVMGVKRRIKQFEKSGETSQLARFIWEFYNEDNVAYKLVLDGDIYRRPKINLSGAEPAYDKGISLTASFDLDNEQYGSEQATNMHEQFRVLSTVVKIIKEAVQEFQEEGYRVDAIYIPPKSDSDREKSDIDSKRGRFYLAYIKKSIKSLRGKWTVTIDKQNGSTFYSIRQGEFSGSNVVGTYANEAKE